MIDVLISGVFVKKGSLVYHLVKFIWNFLIPSIYNKICLTDFNQNKKAEIHTK